MEIGFKMAKQRKITDTIDLLLNRHDKKQNPLTAHQGVFLIHLRDGNCILSAIKIQVNLHSRQYRPAKLSALLTGTNTPSYTISNIGAWHRE